ncbi:transmembrane protein, putative [Medicago truncatula]|uniref:Transmembrane protein, putative n=1 Tax=Medicago truncatula TaxID=3880 RepID=G7JQK9_MEDTR|nr:transmembrane protein, putative [Medicago truncatula]
MQQSWISHLVKFNHIPVNTHNPLELCPFCTIMLVVSSFFTLAKKVETESIRAEASKAIFPLTAI